MSLHYSGILLEWLAEHHLEFFKRLKRLIGSKQIEPMSGGFYEPILPMIPDDDKINQILKLSRFIEKTFFRRSVGMWLAERVWEPHLAESIARAGMSYTVIDDSHFKYAGLQQGELTSYYITEENGWAVRVFPINERLRYLIPSEPPEKTIEVLESLAYESENRLVVFADDGEKFGLWPGSYKECYENKWLDRFFTLLVENQEWIELLTFEEALQKLEPAGRVYLPTASYREMMEWALPLQAKKKYQKFDLWLETKNASEEQKVFVRGGFWRNFLVKYPEANSMHKRMLRSHHHLKSGDSINTRAQEYLFAAQCNCPYWHGVFGGLYLPHLRYAIYSNLIRADLEMESVERKDEADIGWVHANTVDFDGDGYDEIIIETDRLNLFFSPHHGGSLFELDVKEKAINLLDTLARREEPYHQTLIDLVAGRKNTGSSISGTKSSLTDEEKQLVSFLTYDTYRRVSCIDHFIPVDLTVNDFSTTNYTEMGDFFDHPFQHSISEDKNALVLEFVRNGTVKSNAGPIPLRLKKSVHIEGKSTKLKFTYQLENLHHTGVTLRFGSEMAYALLAGNAPDRYYRINDEKPQDAKLAGTGSVENVTRVSLTDEWLGIQIILTSEKPATLWRFPIETVSLSEGGFERIYQASLVFYNWIIKLEPKKPWVVTLEQDIFFD